MEEWGKFKCTGPLRLLAGAICSLIEKRGGKGKYGKGEGKIAKELIWGAGQPLEPKKGDAVYSKYYQKRRVVCEGMKMKVWKMTQHRVKKS